MKKNIVLIGGSHGIGLEMANKLSQNHNVCVASRTKEGLDGSNTTHIPFDATRDELDSDQIPEKIHGFAYCPGTINLKPLKMLSMETFKEDMDINFFSMVKVVKTIMPKMAEHSSMVFFSTVAVGVGMPFHTSVAAAKGAIEGFAKALRGWHGRKMFVKHAFLKDLKKQRATENLMACIGGAKEKILSTMLL